MTYEDLLEEAHNKNIHIIENAAFESKSDGLINGDVIGINKKIRSNKKRACILAEELGHYYTTTGDILDQSRSNNRKQELHARLWAYDKLVGLSGIIASHQAGCQTLLEMAEYLEVTEEFLLEAIQCYRNKYGTYIQVNNCIIFFEPALGVLKLV